MYIVLLLLDVPWQGDVVDLSQVNIEVTSVDILYFQICYSRVLVVRQDIDSKSQSGNLEAKAGILVDVLVTYQSSRVFQGLFEAGPRHGDMVHCVIEWKNLQDILVGDVANRKWSSYPTIVLEGDRRVVIDRSHGVAYEVT